MGREDPRLRLIGIIAATALAAVLGLDELAVVGDIPARFSSPTACTSAV